MLYLLSACLMYDLAGDSVYQAGPDDIPSGVDAGNELPEESNEIGQMEIADLEYSQSEGITDEASIFIEVSDDRIDVVHTNIELACDMSLYEPELSIEERQISVQYMPLDEQRECLTDVRFSLHLVLEAGTYTLTLMEDEAEFVYE